VDCCGAGRVVGAVAAAGGLVVGWRVGRGTRPHPLGVVGNEFAGGDEGAEGGGGGVHGSVAVGVDVAGGGGGGECPPGREDGE
jgi:hypothetical protein